MPTLTIHFEEESDIAYIQLSQEEVVESKIIDDLRWVDLDKNGALVGLQLFEASKRYPMLNRESIEQEAIRAS